MGVGEGAGGGGEEREGKMAPVGAAWVGICKRQGELAEGRRAGRGGGEERYRPDPFAYLEEATDSHRPFVYLKEATDPSGK